MPVIAPPRKATLQRGADAAAGGLGDAALARTETFMPM